ncbi:hypothetical protein DPMN_033249 [Dreissena polymorpha]|uniref:Uncharacterized protein n=1 Tax=Dreissena polymorpha TaxID=45954 RepID=A0A9D4M698_DREPO|nr:hypothetical protein DPMN_033249 [Dreissena polymorpha]
MPSYCYICNSRNNGQWSMVSVGRMGLLLSHLRIWQTLPAEEVRQSGAEWKIWAVLYRWIGDLSNLHFA